MTSTPTPTDQPEPSDFTVNQIQVEGLFGHYNYGLHVPPAPSSELSRLLILYGENGTGKTTILRALYHLLSSSTNKGHKTALAQIPFRALAVSFVNGIRIRASRQEGALLGDFQMTAQRSGTDLLQFTFALGDKPTFTASPESNAFLAELANLLPVDVYYITDERLLETDKIPRAAKRGAAQQVAVSPSGHLQFQPADVQAERDLEFTLQQAIQWLSRQTIRASNRGTEGSNAIYAEVLKRIATTQADEPNRETVDMAISRLSELADRNERYAHFNLVPAIDSDSMLEAARRLDSRRADAFLSVLTPFLDGLDAKLDALSPLYEALRAYVDSLNSFYVGKQVRASLPKGVEIETTQGESLAPSALSSGERQLLLMMTNTLFALEKPGIFLIDEPELSLNMKWQRKLIEALLSTTRGTGTQFVMASHSFEVMASARERVVQLLPYSSDSSHASLVHDDTTSET